MQEQIIQGEKILGSPIAGIIPLPATAARSAACCC